MIVQNLQFPREGENEELLYIWYDDKYCILDSINKRLVFNKRRKAFFDTLFNSFSYEKWRKYTVLDNLSLKLRLQGTFEVTLVRLELRGERVTEYVLSSTKVSSTDVEEFVFTYPPCPAKGIVSFKITPFETGVFYGGAYCTEIEEEKLPDVHIAVCICTYKREDYIKNNMEMLNRQVFSDTASMLHNKLRVYIADNGKTLGGMPSDKIKVFPNINSGGSGGFSRGMLE
ncbi:MAG: hypothetical protein LBB48_01285, partial [Treponema sp.]|nr:hypothetical protein [Treponema sp.]